MSLNQLELFKSSRGFDKYLTSEKENLKRMKGNQNVSDSLYETKATQHNDLVKSLNNLFGLLIDGGEELYDGYEVPVSRYDDPDAVTYDTDYDSSYYTTDVGGEDTAYSPVEQSDEEAQAEAVAQGEAQFDGEHIVDVEDDDSEPDVSAPTPWEAEGFSSREEYLTVKETERHILPDDLSMDLSHEVATHAADKVLDEYEQTTDQDIADYDSEEDTPVEVLDSLDSEEDDLYDRQQAILPPTLRVEGELLERLEAEAEEFDGPSSVTPEAPEDEVETEEPEPENDDLVQATDYSYMTHTTENIRLNDDPAQIADVMTAVEAEGDAGHVSLDVGIDEYTTNDTIDDIDMDDIFSKTEAFQRRQYEAEDSENESVSDDNDDGESDLSTESTDAGYESTEDSPTEFIDPSERTLDSDEFNDIGDYSETFEQESDLDDDYNDFEYKDDDTDTPS